jgi:hypothetical protein
MMQQQELGEPDILMGWWGLYAHHFFTEDRKFLSFWYGNPNYC